MEEYNRGGENINMEDDNAILKIISPRDKLKIYSVVYKNLKSRWAIAAVEWNRQPGLGIRWFWEKNGSPNSRGLPTWFIIPAELTPGILNTLPMTFRELDALHQFLSGRISGTEFSAKA